MWVGHDGGFDSSNNGAKPDSWDHHNDIAVGQFYQVSADMRRPYWVCGGLQDNNAWCGPSAIARRQWTDQLHDWFTVAGGDGFYTRQDPTDWAIVYGESQDGAMSRHDLRNGTQKSIRPNAGRGAVQGGDEAKAAQPPPAALRRQPRGLRRHWRRTRRHSQRDQRSGQASTLSASIGTPPSRSRRTIRPRSTWRRSTSSSPTIAATRGG